MATPKKPGSKKPAPKKPTSITKARNKRKAPSPPPPIDQLDFPTKPSLSERRAALVTDIRDAVEKAMAPKKTKEHHGPKRKAGDPPQTGFWDKVVHDPDYMRMVRRRAEIDADPVYAALDKERAALVTDISKATDAFSIKVGKRLRIDDGEVDTDFVVLEGVARSGGGEVSKEWSKVAATFKYVRTE